MFSLAGMPGKDVRAESLIFLAAGVVPETPAIPRDNPPKGSQARLTPTLDCPAEEERGKEERDEVIGREGHV